MLNRLPPEPQSPNSCKDSPPILLMDPATLESFGLSHGEEKDGALFHSSESRPLRSLLHNRLHQATKAEYGIDLSKADDSGLEIDSPKYPLNTKTNQWEELQSLSRKAELGIFDPELN